MRAKIEPSLVSSLFLSKACMAEKEDKQHPYRRQGAPDVEPNVSTHRSRTLRCPQYCELETMGLSLLCGVRRLKQTILKTSDWRSLIEYISERPSAVKIGVERVNQEKHLVEFGIHHLGEQLTVRSVMLLGVIDSFFYACLTSLLL